MIAFPAQASPAGSAIAAARGRNFRYYGANAARILNDPHHVSENIEDTDFPRFNAGAANPVHLISVGDPPIVLPPRGLLRVAEETSARNVMVDADFSAAQAAEVFLRLIGACLIQ